MGINLPRPSKKIVLLALILLAVILAVLWFAGRQNELMEKTLQQATAAKQAANERYYQELVNRTVYLRNLAGKSLFGSQKLKSLPVASESVILYEESDLNLSSDESEEALRAYGEALGSALKPYGQERANESQLMLEALNQKNSTPLIKLQAVKTLHETTINRLLKITVPESAATIHLKLLNNLAARSLMLGNMLQVFDQPLLALESAQAEYKAANEFYQLAGEINQYFRSRDIIFNPEETVKIYHNI